MTTGQEELRVAVTNAVEKALAQSELAVSPRSRAEFIAQAALAELDSMVAAAEARGALEQWAKINKMVEGTASALNGTSKEGWCGAARCVAFLKPDGDTQAHTQRQRDEGVNTGIEMCRETLRALAESADIKEGNALITAAETILALRRQT